MSGEEAFPPAPPHHSGVMRRLSDTETELLISLVHRWPCLWNENHPDFKDAVLRRKLWKGIAGQLHITGDEAKCKWKNLKDKFRKVRHIQEEKSAAGISPGEPKWRFYNALVFIKDNSLVSENVNGSIVKIEAESDNCVSGDSNDSSSLSSNVVDVDYEIDAPSADKSTSTELTVISSSSALQTQRDRDFQISSRGTKRKKSNISESIKTEVEEMRNVPSKSQDDEKRDDYHFLMSLLPYIEVLDPLEKLELRFGIQKLVTDSYKKHVSKKGSRFPHT